MDVGCSIFARRRTSLGYPLANMRRLNNGFAHWVKTPCACKTIKNREKEICTARKASYPVFAGQSARSSVGVREFTQPVWYMVCALSLSMTKSLIGTKPTFPEFSIDFDPDLISHTLEYRGCGIRAASYELRAQSWLPEACVWLHMDDGHRKIWVHSFAHCFAAEDLTFRNKVEADHWALEAAKSIIDRAFELAPLAVIVRRANGRLRSIAAFARRAIPS